MSQDNNNNISTPNNLNISDQNCDIKYYYDHIGPTLRPQTNRRYNIAFNKSDENPNTKLSTLIDSVFKTFSIKDSRK